MNIFKKKNTPQTDFLSRSIINWFMRGIKDQLSSRAEYLFKMTSKKLKTSQKL
jgi:hypothetical protein